MTQEEIKVERIALELVIRAYEDSWAWIQNHVCQGDSSAKGDKDKQVEILAYSRTFLSAKNKEARERLDKLRADCTHPNTRPTKDEARFGWPRRECVDCGWKESF